MTLQEIYLKGKQILEKSNIESASFDAIQILKKIFNVNRSDLIVKKDIIVSNDQTQNFFNLIKQRANGRPLQYIIGIWEFMGLNFEVGEGVLIPRDDTEVLVNESIQSLDGIKSPKVVDLCSGSGIIAITIAKALKDSQVQAIEISDTAYEFLKRNIQLNNADNVSPLHADIFDPTLHKNISNIDLIVSNPPYIPTKDIDNLQKEVKSEPLIALDGGSDGLRFYKLFIRDWISKLKVGGKISVEVGFNQAESVANLFYKCNMLENIKTVKDINNIERVVSAQKKHF